MTTDSSCRDSFLGEELFDACHEDAAAGFHVAREALYCLPVAGNQVLVEVPLRRLAAAATQVGIQRVYFGSGIGRDVRLDEHREFDSEGVLAELSDFLVAARLLLKIVEFCENTFGVK